MAQILVGNANMPDHSGRIISRDEFMSRFIDSELDAIMDSNGAAAKKAIQLLTLYSSVDLDSNRIDAFMDRLVQGGLITAERKAEILS